MKQTPSQHSRGLQQLLSVLALCAGSTWAAHAQTPFPLGGYFNDPNGSDPVAEAAFETNYNSFAQLMGTAPQFLTRYINQNDDQSNWVAAVGWAAWSQSLSPAKNAIPVIGFPMASKASGALPFDQQFQAFSSGKYDSVIQGVVQTWQQHGYGTQYWRVGWEMNINTSGSSAYAGTDAGTEADWVGAFQHIATVLRQAGNTYGVNVKVIWNPNITNYDQTNTLSNLYPGDSYVDIVAADIYANIYPYGIPGDPNLFYDFDKNDGTVDNLATFIADPVNRKHYWTYPAATQYSLDGSNGHNLSLQVLLDFAKAHGKPFAVPETGAGNSDGGHDVSDEAAFPQWLAQTLQASGDSIAFVNVWDSSADGNYLFSTANAGKPGEAAAWAQGFGVQGTSGLSTTAWYTLVNGNSGKCVDDSGWNSANGTAILQWDCGRQQANQEWQLKPTDSGYYGLVNRNAPNSVIDIVGGGAGDGTPVQLWQNFGNTHQQWMPVALGNGLYKFVDRNSQRCLDVPNASTNNGVQLQIYDCNGTGAQAFQLSVQP